MKHLRKTISLFLSVILVLSVFSLVPFDVIAAEFDSAPKGDIVDSGTTGDCWWRVYEIRHYNSKKEYTYSDYELVIGGTGEMADYIGKSYYTEELPSDYQDYLDYTHDFELVPVYHEDDRPWYYWKYDINKVSIWQGVKNIGDGAFRDFAALESFSYPNTVTSIGNGAFAGCGLEDIFLQNRLRCVHGQQLEERYSIRPSDVYRRVHFQRLSISGKH